MSSGAHSHVAQGGTQGGHTSIAAAESTACSDRPIERPDDDDDDEESTTQRALYTLAVPCARKEDGDERAHYDERVSST